jgi:hypothetical protein
MALPSGCRQVCRPGRTVDRKYSPADLERITCYLIRDGYTPEEVWDAVRVCAGDPCPLELIRLAERILEFLTTLNKIQLNLKLRGRTLLTLLDVVEYSDLPFDDYIDAKNVLEHLNTDVPEMGRIIEGEYEVLRDEILELLPFAPEGTEVVIPILDKQPVEAF